MKQRTILPAPLPEVISRYLDGDHAVSDLHQFPPSMEGMVEAARHRSFDGSTRKVLVEALRAQADKSGFVSEQTLANIDLLSSEETFTVTTGHQLCLFGGPMFFPYKILSTIVLVEKLKERGVKAVPVYWMASEDHDFEEINHAVVHGQRVEWNTAQGGPVGRMALSGIEQVHDELKQILGGNPLHRTTLQRLKEIYSEGKSLSLATRELVDWLFGRYGVITLDADDAALKQRFAPVMQSELKDSVAAKAMDRSTKVLEDLGYAPQVTPRDINLFYLDDGYRERIVRVDDGFASADDRFRWSEEEMYQLAKDSPEALSPNVVLRPVYQEVILPNIAYIGGPGELSYWLQLKPVFEAFDVPFPVVQLRDMALLLDEKTQKRVGQLELQEAELYGPFDEVFKRLVRKAGSHEYLVQERKVQTEDLLTEMIEQLMAFDPTMAESAKAEKARILKRLDVLRKKVLRADKRQAEVTEQRLRDVLKETFPGQVPQERVASWMTFAHADSAEDFLAALCALFDPMGRGLKVIDLD